MIRGPGQLPLGVQLRDDATLDNYLFMSDLEALRSLLETLSRGEGEHQLVLLHGAAGTGRSHLLEAACHAALPGRSQYLPLSQFASLAGDEVLADMEQLDLVCLDELEVIAGKADWEEALFHFYNRCLQSGCKWLCSASAPPSQLQLGLEDLRSRLSAGLVLQMPRASDVEKQQILKFRADRRGLALSNEVARFILARADRGLEELIDLLDQLDRDSIVEKRPLTIPFVKQSLGW